MMQAVLPAQAKIRRRLRFVNQIAAGKHLDGIGETIWMVLPIHTRWFSETI
jgi:hypothetical protein